jgi:hypothetical protein
MLLLPAVHAVGNLRAARVVTVVSCQPSWETAEFSLFVFIRVWKFESRSGEILTIALQEDGKN